MYLKVRFYNPLAPPVVYKTLLCTAIQTEITEIDSAYFLCFFNHHEYEVSLNFTQAILRHSFLERNFPSASNKIARI